MRFSTHAAPKPSSPSIDAALSDATGLSFAARSICGPVRAVNEDRAVAIDRGDAVALVIADGMGGHAHGREAAELVVRCCAEAVQARRRTAWCDVLARGITEAHAQVRRAAQHHGVDGMGATVAAAIAERRPSATPILHWAHAGDSRVYLWRGRTLVRLTDDHSSVAQLVHAGHLSDDEAFDHPDSNIVQRAVGQPRPFEPELHTALPLDHGDAVLVCSDGLHGALRDRAIAAVVDGATRADALCQQLIDAALDADSHDNVSVACLIVPPRPRAQRRRPTRANARRSDARTSAPSAEALAR
ncbi:MAG: protein phosphatase 2C domain-containing protein [Acidobacteriota bacterium]